MDRWWVFIIILPFLFVFLYFCFSPFGRGGGFRELGSSLFCFQFFPLVFFSALGRKKVEYLLRRMFRQTVFTRLFF